MNSSMSAGIALAILPVVMYIGGLIGNHVVRPAVRKIKYRRLREFLLADVDAESRKEKGLPRLHFGIVFFCCLGIYVVIMLFMDYTQYLH